MADAIPRQTRLATLETLRTDAARLMTEAKHDTLKAQVRLATKVTEEARHYLDDAGIDSNPAILAIVDAAIALATYRLNAVAQEIKIFGPGGALRGG